MTREEAIKYAEAIKAKTQEKIEFYRRGHAHAPEVYYSDLAFLSAAISALREQEERQWIPVSERFPSKSGRYVVIVEEHTSVLNYSSRHKMFNAFDDLDQEFAERHAIMPTHWMPLPEPPKEGE